jgi:hypothetical protein
VSYPTFLTAVERQIREEREAQDTKWGEQNHPDGTGPKTPIVVGIARMHEAATAARQACQRAASEGDVTWRHILLEEVFEAFTEEDPAELRTELIQVAAVAQQWIEAIDRRGGA